MTATLDAQVCIVGGGPAGLTLGVELARRNVSVIVVEQSARFDRSFRGESVSPDSVWLLDELGLLDRLEGQYLQMQHMEIVDAGKRVFRAHFGDFKYPHPYPIELPQPTLLSALADVGADCPSFTLLHGSTALGLINEGDRVSGIRVRTPDGEAVVRATLTVAADGRFSKVREMAGLAYTRVPLERDVVWLRLPFPTEWDDRTYRIRIAGDHHGLFIPTHPDSVRVGFNIPKGGLRELRGLGLPALYERLDQLAPELSESVRRDVRSWSDTSILDIFTTVVPKWSRPGLLLVGDAAHTLTPILGQGVNHAIIDAVTAAPMLAEAFSSGASGSALDDVLVRFQASREESVRRSRKLQLRQERLFAAQGARAVMRRALYRAMSSHPALIQRALSGAYFQLQTPGPRKAQKQVAASHG
ncbi:MAG TPA: FAD-dependent oxidoreductase [Jatrophihabitantaceae bacterium]